MALNVPTKNIVSARTMLRLLKKDRRIDVVSLIGVGSSCRVVALPSSEFLVSSTLLNVVDSGGGRLLGMTATTTKLKSSAITPVTKGIQIDVLAVAAANTGPTSSVATKAEYVK